jgi:mRNA degradation ribonuclease J1/J2
MVLGQSDNGALLAEAGAALVNVIAQVRLEERADLGVMKDLVRSELGRYFKKRTGRRPMIIPVLMEI